MKNIVAKVLCMTIITSISLVSCHNDLYLDPVSQISGSSFWKTPDDAKSGLNGMYVRLRDQSATNFLLWGEARSENQVPSFGIAYWTDFMFRNTLDRNSPGPVWQGMYTIIHDANLIIKYVPDINFGSESEKNNILAQAYATRAFVYFVLTRTWGDLPLATEPFEAYSAEIVQRGRSSQADVFTLIKSDIDEALNLFPDNRLGTRNYWSKPATYALKADVNLWTAKRNGGGNADLNIALEALNNAETGDVVLLNNFADIFDYENKGNQEILMSITFKYLESGQTYHNEMYMTGGYWPSPDELDDETIEAVGALGGQPYYQISPEVRKYFSDDDQRKKASYIDVYKYDESGDKTYYCNLPCKFNGTVINGVRYFYDDIVLYRYADILLMRAEVKNALGQDPSSDINKIRERAYGDNYSTHVFVNGSKEDNDVVILRERLLEFVLEGKYWWDLIRFDQVFELVPSLVGKSSNRYLLLWPISLTTLSLEPNVQQNPGW